MQSRIFIAASFALSLLFSQGAFAQVIYTWKDAKGVQQFSHNPPMGVDAKIWRGAIPGGEAPDAAQSGAAATPSQTAPKSLAQQEQEFRQRRAAQADAEEKAKKEATAKAEKKALCEELRRNIAMYERGGRIGAPDAKGEWQEYSDSQVQSELSKMRSRHSRECK